MKILKLPPKVQNKLQSGVVISDATQCILELVYNSLDANASSIAVRVNFKKYYIQVVDNGIGFTKEDLTCLGQRHMTNKCSRVEELESLITTFGYRGSALASIANVCGKIEVQSRHSSGTATYTKVISKGRLEQVVEAKTNRPVHGTTVTVLNLMASMPVRRKRIKEVFDLDDVLYQLEALAVIHSHVSFSLRNDRTGKVLLQTHRHDNVQLTLSDLFGLAAGSLLIPIRYGRGNLKVSGVVCRQLHTDCSLQLVYVNRRIIHKSKVHTLVTRLINKYGNIWGKDRQNSQEIVDVDGFVFIVKIECPYESFSLERNGRMTSVVFRNSEEVLKLVGRAVKSGLKEDCNNSSGSNMRMDSEVAEIVTREKGNPIFGPSQLNNVVHGKCTSRKVEASVGKTNEGVVEKVRILSPIVEKSQNDNGSKTPECTNTLQRYKEAFFRERSGNGTVLVENAPIYEIPDFSHIPYHDFLAWLKVKSSSDSIAMKLLSELNSLKSRPPSKTSSKTLPLVSLKEIRNEKFAMRSRLMLKKIERDYTKFKNQINNYGNGSTNPLNVSRKTLHKETTTYFQTPKWAGCLQMYRHPVPFVESPYVRDLPQVSFNEFVAWLQFKANHNNTAKLLLAEFLSFKTHSGPAFPLASLKETRRRKLALRSEKLVKHVRGFAANLELKETPKIDKKLFKVNLTSEKLRTTTIEKCEEIMINTKKLNIPVSNTVGKLKRRKTSLTCAESPFFNTQNGFATPSMDNNQWAKINPQQNVNKPFKKVQDDHDDMQFIITNNFAEKSSEVIKSQPTDEHSVSFTTWSSHYANGLVQPIENTLARTGNKQGRLIEENNLKEPPITKVKKQNMQSIPTVITCSEVTYLKNSQHSSIPENIGECNISTNGKRKADVELDSVREIFDAPHVPLEASLNDTLVTQVRNQEIQACPIVKDVATLAVFEPINTVSNSVQTDTFLKAVCNKDTQTEPECYQDLEQDVKLLKTVSNVDQSKNSPDLLCGENMLDTPLLEVLRTYEQNSEVVLPDTVPTVWTERKDTLERTFYIHSASGFTTFEPPASSTKNSFLLRATDIPAEKAGEVPSLPQEGLDELRAVVIDSCNDDLKDIKWGDYQDGTVKLITGVSDIGLLKEAAKRSTIENSIISAKLSKPAADVQGLLSSFALNKEDLMEAKVVGQLDKKFIVALLRSPINKKLNIVCLFDQHAVHERITLEMLMEKYQKGEGCESELLKTPIVLTVPSATIAILKAKRDHFNIHGLSLDPQGSTAVIVKAVPACFLRRQEREAKVYRQSSLMRLVTDLLNELTEHLTSTRGAGLTTAKTVMDVIASEACRAAIKFNQSLSIKEMMKMITQLHHCRLPFQCAHGRPSVMPIFELEETTLTVEPSKLNFKKLKK